MRFTELFEAYTRAQIDAAIDDVENSLIYKKITTEICKATINRKTGIITFDDLIDKNIPVESARLPLKISGTAGSLTAVTSGGGRGYVAKISTYSSQDPLEKVYATLLTKMHDYLRRAATRRAEQEAMVNKKDRYTTRMRELHKIAAQNNGALPSEDLIREYMGILKVPKTKVQVHSDLTVTIKGDVSMHDHYGAYEVHNEYKRLPVNFREVTGHFAADYVPIETLEGIPSVVGGYLTLNNTQISKIEGHFKCHQFTISATEITSLKNIHKHVTCKKFVALFMQSLKSSILGLVYFPTISVTLSRFRGTPELEKVDEIIIDVFRNYHTPSTRIYHFQEMLIDAGFEELAQL